jgi:hypothetical protein
VANARKFTVEILNFGKILTKAGFSNPPNAGEPDDGALLPCAFEQFQPESPVYHTVLCEIVRKDCIDRYS